MRVNGEAAKDFSWCACMHVFVCVVGGWMDGSMDGRVRALFMCLHMCGWMHARACVFYACVHVCVCMYDACMCAWMDG